MFKLFRHTPRIVLQTALWISLTLLSGCASFSFHHPFEDFYAHTEDVFRHQNLVIDQVMLANETLNEADYKKLSNAELFMYDQCRLLNDYAVRERDGLEQDYFKHKDIIDSIDGCEASIFEVEKLLHHH